MTALALDSSALTAVVFGEPDAELLVATMAAHAGDLHVSAVTLVETSIVVEAKQGHAAYSDLQALLRSLAVTTVPVDAAQAHAAVAAWRRFGKGRHPASLNLGDCFSYALAKRLSAQLLFKGRDFPQTDVSAAY